MSAVLLVGLNDVGQLRNGKKQKLARDSEKKGGKIVENTSN